MEGGREGGREGNEFYYQFTESVVYMHVQQTWHYPYPMQN